MPPCPIGKPLRTMNSQGDWKPRPAFPMGLPVLDTEVLSMEIKIYTQTFTF